MLKRCLIFMICLSLAVGIVGGSFAESFTMAGFDGQDASHDWATNGFFTRMEAQTGVSFTFDVYTDATKWQSAKTAMFSEGGTLPDVLFKAALTQDELIRYSESGQLIDLGPLLEQYAPHLWALLQEHPDWLEAITLPSGKIAALPCINPYGSQNAMWINKAWLDKLGLEMPEDLESLRTVLEAFRDQDPNGNGKKDEIPVSYLGIWDLKFFSHAWGVTANDYNIYEDANGQVHYWPLEDSFVEFARTMREFYKDGLLDANGFSTTDTLRQVTDDDTAETYGLFFGPSPISLLSSGMVSDYVLLSPLAFNGERVYRDLGTSITTGAFAITSACKDPGVLLSWVDTLYTEEGATLAMLGQEGINYTVNEEGKWSYTASSYSAVSNETVYDSGCMPWLFPWEVYKKYDDESITLMCGELEKLKPYLKTPSAGGEWLYGEKREHILALQDQLGSYVDTTLASWILGETEITDETIAAFHQGLRECGCEEMTAYWQQRAEEPH